MRDAMVWSQKKAFYAEQNARLVKMPRRFRHTGSRQETIDLSVRTKMIEAGVVSAGLLCRIGTDLLQ
jgi:hypothetical protein